MSYTEQATKINKQLKDVLFNDRDNIDIIDINKLSNVILWFGQVAKYRCRSNVAYDNFAKEVFKDIAELERTKLEGQEFEVLLVKEVTKNEDVNTNNNL